MSEIDWIARAGAGLDNIDEAAAAALDITLFNAPEGNRDAVGEHVIGMLLSLFNKLTTAHAEVSQGIWQREANRGIELKGKTVGYEQGTIQEAYAKAVLDKAGVKTQAYQNQDQVYSDLTSGRLDAGIQDMLQAELGFLKSPKGEGYEVSKPVDSELLPAKTAVGIKKGNSELKALLDKGIKALHDDGKYAEIQKKHFGDLNLYSGK